MRPDNIPRDEIMMRRYARWVALTLLLVVAAGCPELNSENRAITEFNKGDVFSQREDWDAAIACYSEAVRLKPDYVAAYNKRGFAYLNKGEIGKAMNDFSEAIRLEPSFAMAYSNRGFIYQKQGEIDKAIKEYSEAIRLKPDYVGHYLSRGGAYKEKGDQAKADADFAKAKEL